MSQTASSIRFRAEDRGVLEVIAELGELEGCRLHALGQRLIVDRYFDTVDWALMAQRCSYRERQFERRRWVAFRGPAHAVTAPAPAPGLEAELPDGITLEDAGLLLPPVLRAWVAAGYRPLAEILLVENNRTLIELVEEGEPRFLLCLDDVEFFANGSPRRCCEVKLDARRDPNGRIHWIIYTLQAEFRLAPTKANKLQQGLALTGAEPRLAVVGGYCRPFPPPSDQSLLHA
jgi:hypothetical protein